MHSITLEEIHRDPAVLDRALEQREFVEILNGGKIAGTLIPAAASVMRLSKRGFPISKGLASFTSADVDSIEIHSKGCWPPSSLV